MLDLVGNLGLVFLCHSSITTVTDVVVKPQLVMG